ncbi:MAG: TonB-dependent receptor [Crocinitomicaceae bacterium]|nr:TonB-dependent receptor [Crocinitomicaceae bacterium]
MNLHIKSILLLIFFLLSFSGFSQVKTYTGRVVDAETNEGIPYATVVLVSKVYDAVLDGTTTFEDGLFQLNSKSSDSLFIKITFFDYGDSIIEVTPPESGLLDLKEVKLKPSAIDLEGVNVSAEKSSMEFKLDKRVFNVGKDISTTGMGAMEVLNNVPSVSVDIEGNIKLRGNSGVQILINGKPSVLSDDPASALGTITADMIESIEVITNPSAKYDAGGTSGILNIILKKDEKRGFNGSISLNTGWPHNHSIGGSINYRTKKFNLFTQFGAGYRSLPRYNKNQNSDLTTGTTVSSDGIAYRDENFYNITLGSDYYINKYNTITLSGNFAYEIEQQPSETNITVYDQFNQVASQYQRKETTSALNPKYRYELQYKKEFKNNKEHTLQFSSLGRYFGKAQESDFTNTNFIGTTAFRNQKTETTFFQLSQTFQLDYVNPLTENWTIESGAMYDINDVGNDFAVYDEDNGIFVVDSNFTNNFEYNQKVLGVYSTGAYEGEKWGLKLGLRLENTDLTTVLTNTNERNNQNFTNLFTTVHTSYKVSKKVQFQAGYSRRIFRPRLWDLNPFFNIQNNYNIRTGNPDLLPEFADSYELTSIFYLKKIMLNASLYYLYTTDVKERITYFENDISVTRPVNVGINHKVGVELNWKYTVNKWFSANGDVNYGYFNRQGEFESQNFDFQGDQWSTRAVAKFKFKKGFDLELTGNYESEFKTVQGITSGFASADFGMRQKIWKGKAVVSFAVRDIFASRIRETVIDQQSFYLYSFSQRGRFITLGFSYSFGKGEAMSYTGGRRR